MIGLGVLLLIVGLLAHKLAALAVIGLILIVVGIVLEVLGTLGRAVGGRRHYY
jgi:steroid 5-alpha reductase family enzyme